MEMKLSKKKDALGERKKRLKEQLDKVDAQLKDISAREKNRERKEDTRRKIIMGGLCDKHMRANPNSDFTAVMARLINEYVITDNDRALFRLPPLPPIEQDNRKQQKRYNRAKKEA